jgi:hypothetical protein
MTAFLRMLDPTVDEKPNALLRAIRALAEGSPESHTTFERAPGSFSAVPGSPFAYWLGPRVRELFSKLPKFESDGRTAKIGASTKNNFRFLRLDWELGPAVARTRGSRWVPFAKGGKRSPYYADIYLLVKWEANAREIEAELLAKFPYLGSNAEFVLHRSHPHFRAGATWTLRASRFAPQFLPAGCVFSDRGYAAFVPEADLAATVGAFNSLVFDYLFKVALGRHGFPEFIVGTLQSLPWKDFSDGGRRALSASARRAWSLMRSLDSTNESSHAFLLPERCRGAAPLDRAAIDIELTSLQQAVDDAAFAHYGIVAEDRATIELAAQRPASSSSSEDDDVPDEDEDDSGDDDLSAGGSSDTLGSWLVGVAFGRFDPRLATGERAIPPEPEPFAPLPSRSPGMYPEGEEPAERPDILVDDEGHADDLAARVQAVAERVKVDVPENLRAWLAKEFFPLHIKMYSKSRRKAPIYWQLATPSASYSVWLYIHAFSKDTLFRVQNDYVAPKLAHEERRLESLTSELRDGATAAQRKTLGAQEAVVDELRAFLDEVKRVAPLWKPNLDDGVIINFAPLWRLVPCEGKYDWAHLAMHLWPERVVPKCAKDRSLAIAHGLEDVFWVEGTDGKWTARKTPMKSVDELVKERTSSAVKSALKSLLEAPVASGAARKTKKGKANA